MAQKINIKQYKKYIIEELSLYTKKHSRVGIMTPPPFQKIFPQLKTTLQQYKQPIVSREKPNVPHNAFTVLISCLLSLRTKDEVTAEASIRLLQTHHTPEQLLTLSEEEITKKIYPVGFYKTKAKRILEICTTLLNEYNGKVPNDFNKLLKLKGVGKKTAAIVMVYGHEIDDYIPVDIHVHVIANRLGWVNTKNPDDTMDELMKFVPKRYWYDLNNIFVLFGQNICVTVSPKCSKCPINKYCPKIGVKNSR